MERFDIVEATDENRWLEILDQVGSYDVYFLPSCHRLSAISDQGKGVLLAYIKDELVVVFPLLIRDIDKIHGLEKIGQGWHDAVSVYGYAGPLASRALNQNEKEIFWSNIKEYFDYAKLVSVFSSIHPLFQQESILNGFGQIIPTNPTISIDLTLSPDKQWRNYRKGHRTEIKKLIKLGYYCIEDRELQYWDDFVHLYYTTMKRINAASYFFFHEEFFLFIKNQIKDRYKLFVSFYKNTIVEANLYTLCHGIIQAHFVGVHEEYIRMSIGKLVEDTVRLWGNEIGAHTFHLGRGLGGAKDSLYYYKQGFSKREHPYNFWRFINNKEVYRRLLQEQYKITGADPENNYFPLYRHPGFFERK